MLRRHLDTVVALAVALALAFPLVALSRRALAQMGVDRPYDFVHVPDGNALRFVSPALRLSVADLYWLGLVQYVGERRAEERGWDKLYPVADLVTDLDPRHGYAYHSIGIALGWTRQLDAADRLLEKGIRQGPNWWSYPWMIAFNHLFFRGDYATAARWAELAARTPGASPNVSRLALSLKLRTGSPDDAVRLLEELRATAKDETTAHALEEQWRVAVHQRNFAALDSAVAAYRARHRRAPGTLDEVRRAGLLPEIPSNPYGGRYYVKPDGTVHSTEVDERPKPVPPTGPTPLMPNQARLER